LIDGEDEQAAMKEIKVLFTNRFGEES